MFLSKGVLKSCVIAGLSMGIGDVIMQQFEKKQNSDRSWNSLRTLRFAFVGFTYNGPFFHFSLGQLEKMFGNERTLRIALKKSIFVQCVFSPILISFLFPYISLLEGKTLKESLYKTQTVWWPTYKVGLMYWPVINLCNFLIFPPGILRVICISTSGVIWNCYMSYVNYKANIQLKE